MYQCEMLCAPISPVIWFMGKRALRKTKKDCWVIINGRVLDLTSFLPALHPRLAAAPDAWGMVCGCWFVDGGGV